jgi:malonate-semialdehyde dehydrogenase (acetylating)/methylmalonate-semialdehyde dehydrogenase
MTDTSSARELRNYVAGAWVTPDGVSWLDDLSPADGALLARVPLSGAVQVGESVAAAAGAQREWREVPVPARARALYAIREQLQRHADELAELVVADMGKTFDDARAEVGRGIESVEAASSVAVSSQGRGLHGIARGLDVEVIRQPLGVVAAITPFNFPAMIPLWFLPYAIVTGNGFVLKPSERDPLPAVRIVELISELDVVPDGLISLVHGGREAVEAILADPGIAAISFVGQTSTARVVAEGATRHGKRVQALGGAKNALVVLPDADPGMTCAAVLSSAFGAAGQRCLAGSVLVLVGTSDQQDAILRRIVREAAGLAVGAGGDPKTDVCPLVGPDARERIVGRIDTAAADGATIHLDGREVEPGPAGTLLGPTIVEVDDVGDRMVREEIFGPVLSVVRAGDLDGALDWVNASEYGNSALLFTRSGAAERRFRDRVEAGMLGVNIGIAAPVAWFPFAGWKQSFFGSLHANGTDAFEFYTRQKVITSRWPADEAPALHDGWDA